MNRPLIVTAVLMLALGGGVGYWVASKSVKEQARSALPEQKKPLFYRSPMNPSVTSPVPAKDAMGMDYVPVFAEENHTEQGKILFYRNPMNPEVTSPTPTKDAMGMDYVPVYAEADFGLVGILGS